jgi:cytochrome c oxidase subunit 3
MKNEKTQKAPKQSYLKRVEKENPFFVMFYLGMLGVLVLFVFLTGALAFAPISPEAQAVTLPWPFWVSTLVIGMSSLVLELAWKRFKEDDFVQLRIFLLQVGVLGGIFTALQILGWGEWHNSGAALYGGQGEVYLYLLTGLHLLHLAGGLLLLAYVWQRVNRAHQDPVKVLVSVTDPAQVVWYRALRHYWHFLGGVWVLLFVVMALKF